MKLAISGNLVRIALPHSHPLEQRSHRFWEPVEKAYIAAVQQGCLPENTLDTALIRMFTARIKLGMFDPPDIHKDR